MKKLWKGLFHCVWHANKVPVQTNLIDRLSSWLPKLDLSLSIQYLSNFLHPVCCKCNGIDVLRLDKLNNSWDLELSCRLMGVLQERTFLANEKSLRNGVNYHISSIFLEEMSSFFPLQLEVLDVLLGPFLSIKSNMFDVLLRKWTKLLEVKKSGEDVDSGSNIMMFVYELGSSSECCKGNRKVLYSPHEEFLKLERDLRSLGIDILMRDVIDNDEEEVPKLIPIESTGVISQE
ncbi:hypothetical protein UlMin_006857 [Ulmus minor]